MASRSDAGGEHAAAEAKKGELGFGAPGCRLLARKLRSENSRARAYALQATPPRTQHPQTTPRGSEVRSLGISLPAIFGEMLDFQRRADGTRPCAGSITGVAQSKSWKGKQDIVVKIWLLFIPWFETGYRGDDGTAKGGYEVERLNTLSEKHSCEHGVWEGFATYLYTGYLTTKSRQAAASKEIAETHVTGSTALNYFGAAFQMSLRRCAPSLFPPGFRVCSRAHTTSLYVRTAREIP